MFDKILYKILEKISAYIEKVEKFVNDKKKKHK
jgi:hypothetical protein